MTPRTLRSITGMGLATALMAAFTPATQTAPPLSPSHTTLMSSLEEVETNPEDNELLLVMDASGSMSESDDSDTVRIEAARDALHSVVDDLDDDLSVGLRVFSAQGETSNDAACQDSDLAVEIGSDNRDDLRDAIDSYDAVGDKTPIAYALEEAAGDLGAEGNRTIVLVSDGQENCAPDPCEVAQTITDKGIDLAIHTVGYSVDDEARQDLECIAQAGNGEYFDADDAETLNNTLQRLSLRAFQPFQLEGEPVEGAADIADAPALEPGQYVDTWKEGPQYYRIPRTMENSSLHVGASAIHNDTSSFDPLTVALGTEDAGSWETYRGGSYSTNDQLCSQVNLYEGTNDAALRVRSDQVTVFPDPEEEETDCNSADELILQLEAISNEDPNAYVGQPVEFVVTEEPEVANMTELPSVAEGGIREYQWQSLEVDQEQSEELLGGNSFNNAPTLEAGGAYSSEIYPGESLVYKIPVEWGQHLQAQLETPGRAEFGPDLTVDRGFRLQIYSPHRGLIQHTTQAQGQEGKYYGLTNYDEPKLWQNMTHPVRWANRASPNAGHNDMEFASTAGDYYILVSQSEVNSDQQVAVPFDLVVDTFGEVEGEPQYATASATNTEDDDDAVAAEPTQPAEAVTPNVGDAERTGLSTTQTVFLGIGIAGLLLLVIGAFVLYRVLKTRNRSSY
ncbi:VWA domain-containing protein [Yaniella flava]|uniref:VWA domain-containing protein n=1 Tax=Yaniella flava TaxID=287930 RepID=A0ABP5GBA7_9MICC